MPKSSYAEQLHDAETLLKAVRETEVELPGVLRYKLALERASTKAAETKARREALVISAQEATYHMHAAFQTYREAATSLRNFIKSVLGHRNEKLLRYGVRPIRRRSRPVHRVTRPAE
jgi:hypothetical protein